MKSIKDLFPRANDEVCQIVLNGRRFFAQYGITTDAQFQMWLAQMAHESAGFKHLRELSYRNTTFEEKYGRQTRVGKILGNTEPGDGEKYKGRGIIQLTGRWNYTFYGDRISEDLVSHPELAQQPFIAFKLSLAYWKQRNVGQAADQQDVRAATKLINGGSNGLKDRERIYKMLEFIKMLDYVR